MKKLYTLLFLLSYVLGGAQISFTDRTELLTQVNHYSGVALGVTDMNGDGLDDLVRLDDGRLLNIEFQNEPGQKFTQWVVDQFSGGSQWSMCVADVDNDGMNDVMAGAIYSDIEIIKLGNDGETYEMYILPSGDEIFVQGSNFVDINNDGLLDIFACHDDGASYIWGNEGDGTFTPRTDWIDLSYQGSFGENASGNYGSVWTDFDNDGDVDLYIAKCRQGATDVTDPRRINQLHVNNGDGTWTESAASHGLASGWQSWTADFQDINNDGLLDCFITNHDYQAQMMLNDGNGQFVELENTGIELDGTPIQGVMRDFDNDGWIDVLVAGSKGQLFKNNGDLTFTEITGLFDGAGMESYALGDLNADGYVDILGGYANIYTTPSNINDKVWMNNGGTNNYLSVSTQGVISNRNGIGSKIYLYGEWGIQSREVRSGESYGIMNSQTQYFGLGTATEIDSMVIIWPSGIRQVEENIEINSFVQLLEGGCIAASPEIEVTGETTICPGDSVIISAEEGFENYLWSNGETSTSIVVKESGNYTLQVENEEGCTGFSTRVIVTVDPELTPVLTLEGTNKYCQGEEVVLSTEGFLGEDPSVEWSSGQLEESITVSESGIYSFSVEGLCREFESNSLELTFFELPDAPEIDDVDIEEGESANLMVEGPNTVWYDSETSTVPIAFGNSYTTPILTEDRSYYVSARSGDGIEAKVGMTDHSGSLYSNNPNDNDGIRFNALKDFVLDSVKVYTDIAGVRTVVLRDGIFGPPIASVDIDVPEGEHFVYLGLEISEGEGYYLTTDFIQNEQTTGNFGPRFQRSSTNVNFPYELDDVVRLRGSGFGSDFYYFFYDWKVSQGTLCEGPRSEVNVNVEVISDVTSIDLEEVSIYPNPTTGQFTVDLKNNLNYPCTITILDATGKTVVQKIIQNEVTIFSDLELENGLYQIQISDEERIHHSKMIITK